MRFQLFSSFKLICKLMACGFLLSLPSATCAQTDNLHKPSTAYQWPEDPQVRQKLADWQDKKFGVIIHWGLYAVPGIIESWSINSEDWIERDSTIRYDDYKKWYWGLSKQFNPQQFDPAPWAAAAREAGMKYLVFTTKHHDGFAMFNTAQSDFSIVKGPFGTHPRADVTRHVFDAFRKEGFMIGAYFSKPDWHSQDYWWDKYATPNRNNNYDIRKHPARWNRFKGFTYKQIEELMRGYGPVDILWLDGGWVRPLETVNDEVRSWGAPIPPWSQDIDMAAIARMARTHQPGLLMVDRTVHGAFENYQTPEQSVPKSQLSFPWESCMTLGNNWGWVPGDPYKTAKEVVHKLVEIVAKGGNLLLGVGPRPDGSLDPLAVARLAEIGAWTRMNGTAIYNTRDTAHYKDGNTWFTQSTDGARIYAVHLISDSVPPEITWEGNTPAKGSKIILIQNGKPLPYKVSGHQVTVKLPSQLSGPAVALSLRVK